MLQPGEFAFGSRGGAELPAGVEQQILRPPVGFTDLGVTDDQVGLEVRPPVVPQGVPRDDADTAVSGGAGPQLREHGPVGVGLLPAAPGPLLGTEGEQEGADAAGRVEEGRVRCHLADEVAYGTHDPLRGDLVRSGPAYGVGEALREDAHRVRRATALGQLPREPDDVRRKLTGPIAAINACIR